MPKYLIERDMPQFGQKPIEEIEAAVRKTVDAVEALGQKIHWLESFVCDDKVYAVYLAPDEQALQELAKKTGIPATRISEVRMVVDPAFVETGRRSQFRPVGKSQLIP